MDLKPEAFLNIYVVIYLAAIVLGQLACGYYFDHRRKQIALRRQAQGLPAGVLMEHAERLRHRRAEAGTQSLVLLVTVVIVPFVLVGVANLGEGGDTDSAGTGLAVIFLVLVLWVLLNGTDVAKAFFGGLAFKTLAAFKAPFQVGDRVTLKGVGGKVTSFDTFFVTLQTPNDDLVSIPTAGLWSEVLNSANAGARSSLCVIEFYLSPLVKREQRQQAEDAIWNAIQASAYFDPNLPLQIYLRQNLTSIQLTAKAYVASTYNEPLFASDVNRAFLDFASANDIALAVPIWQGGPES